MSQLTEPVEISLKSSEEALREALAFAAKTEDPQVNMAISQMIFGIQQILNYHKQSAVFHFR